MNTPSVPQQIGKYRILSVLGEGAMGVVYRAHDPSIDREVALKTIRKQALASEEMAAMMVERFRREAVAAGRLTHPGIVAVYDYGEVDDVAFIVMELAPGARSTTTGSDAARSVSRRSARSSGRCSRRSATPTRAGWSTATSSRPTCWCR